MPGRPQGVRAGALMHLSVQGWFRQGFFLWPLWCPSDPPCPAHCFTTGRFLPFVALHLIIFYVSAAFIFILRRKNKWPEHTGFDPSFDQTFYIAWHMPMMVMAFPLGLMAIMAGREVWLTGDRFMEYGYISDPLVSEIGTWFICFIAVDAVLMMMHRLGGKEIYLHHAIFSAGAVFWIRHCCAPLTMCILMTQELSTPWLNLFTLCRAYKGLSSIWTQGSFLIFAVLFYIFRVFFNTFCTVHFLCEVLHGFWGSPALRMPRWEGVALALIMLAQWFLQLFWARKIALKFYHSIQNREAT